LSNYGGYQDQDFIAELYDAVYENRNQRDVQFFVDCALGAGGPVLELGCGTGRVLIPTALAGCRITGLDISPFMLAKCRAKLASQSPEVRQRVRLVQGNMVDFRSGERYSLVTIPFRPFQHLIDVKEQRACLERAREHLVERGLLVLDLFHCYPPAMYDPKYRAEQPLQQNLPLADGSTVSFATRIADFHRDRQYNDIELIYRVTYAGGGQERLVQAFPFRYFFRYEVEHLLELSGFEVADLFGNYDRSAFQNDSPEMIFVARRKD
jgi:SAM-dependent methyltransferase